MLKQRTGVPRDEITADSERLLLEAAAELILESGTREIDVSELSARAKVKRPTIYARYRRGQRQSPGSLIYLRILREFLKAAESSIKAALAVVDRSEERPTPGEELAAVLSATLTAFRENELFGKVVLQELSLKNPEEMKLIRPIFDEVDKIIELARGAKHLDQGPSDDWKIRQILFVLMRGLLRTLYLDQYDTSSGKRRLSEKSELTEKEVEVEILRVLSLYAFEESERNVKKTIEVLAKRKDKRPKTDSSE